MDPDYNTKKWLITGAAAGVLTAVFYSLTRQRQSGKTSVPHAPDINIRSASTKPAVKLVLNEQAESKYDMLPTKGKADLDKAPLTRVAIQELKQQSNNPRAIQELAKALQTTGYCVVKMSREQVQKKQGCTHTRHTPIHHQLTYTSCNSSFA